MSHLATLEDTCNTGDERLNPRESQMKMAVHESVVKKVSESNPLFEAFGNAKTVRNDNSSRFGKFTKLHFDLEDRASAKANGRNVPGCSIAGGTFDTYLLEKARVVGHADGERTFHLFYQLLAAPGDEKVLYWTGLRDTTFDDFRYVGNSGCDEFDDGKDWEETRTALIDFGFEKGGEDSRLRTILRAVCAVLQLGNVAFGPDPSSDEGSLVSTPEELKKLSDVLGVPAREITAALTTRLIATAGETITVPLSPIAARDGCDALAKEIYSQVFEELVEAINRNMEPPPLASGDDASRRGWVSILDMFGFESFAVNRFEQLCINYANERIQNKYVMDTFLQLKEEYEEEGIDIYDFSKVDNSDVLHLIESPTGLIGVLNDECVRPKGSDESFVYKLKTIHKDSRRLKNDRLQRPHEFCVSHFAGDVKYDARNFISSNQDQLRKLLLDCASTSTNELISRRFKATIEASKKVQSNFRRRRAPTTLTTKFKGQLNVLMKDIQDARTRYIRCIKPNSEKLPLIMDHDMTMRQLASAGLVTAITVSRETFPSNMRYDVIWDRFSGLLPTRDHPPRHLSVEDKAKHLLSIMLKGKEKVVGGSVIGPYACGKTKVFFRSGSLEVLESVRSGLYSSKAKIIQRWYRSFLAERRREAMEALAILLQAQGRRMAAQKLYQSQRAGAINLQCFVRCALARALVKDMRRNKAATTIQSKWKARGQAHQLIRIKRAVDVIRRAMRNRKKKNNFTAAMAVVVEDAQWDRKMKVLQRKLDDPSSTSQSKDELLKQSSEMMRYLGGQLFDKRGELYKLKSDAKRRTQKSKHMETMAAARDAGLAANKLEVRKLQQENERLRAQVHECKSGTANLRLLLRKMQDAHDKSKKKYKEEYSVMQASYKREIDALKDQILSLRRDHANTLLKAAEKASQAEEKYRSEIIKLQGEIRRAEELHAEDLSNMMEALGTAHEFDTAERKGSDSGDLGELQKIVEIAGSLHRQTLGELKLILCDSCVANASIAINDLEENMEELLKRVSAVKV